ncbi:hypothetical protein SAMN04488094_10137 [Tropicimonas isoalkanivorans]|uniref:Chitin binding Peritrophin-A domain-containing protein n=1 Tax=Tropicimonas isoalkanivorans TaxID=441112 RepID=A0A1I1D731_9RHOB|nr:hypothetical protein SAMN04488094_10137 [Tropicimonas isoalkanivorans]
MQLKTMLAALALAALPTFAGADCSVRHPSQSATNCPQGTLYDAQTGSCTKQVSS